VSANPIDHINHYLALAKRDANASDHGAQNLIAVCEALAESVLDLREATKKLEEEFAELKRKLAIQSLPKKERRNT
jgi:hypothetical protein